MFEGTIPAQDNSNTLNNRLMLRMLQPAHEERVNVVAHPCCLASH
jgi:hypothetical protein